MTKSSVSRPTSRPPAIYELHTGILLGRPSTDVALPVHALHMVVVRRQRGRHHRGISCIVQRQIGTSQGRSRVFPGNT